MQSQEPHPRTRKRWLIWSVGMLPVLLVLTAGVAAWAMSHYVIVTDYGTAVLDKRYWTLEKTYIDLRKWSYEDFGHHPDVKKALLTQGYRDVVTSMAIMHAQTEAGRLGEYVGNTWNRGMTSLNRIATHLQSRWNCMRDNQNPDA